MTHAGYYDDAFRIFENIFPIAQKLRLYILETENDKEKGIYSDFDVDRVEANIIGNCIKNMLSQTQTKTKILNKTNTFLQDDNDKKKKVLKIYVLLYKHIIAVVSS